MPMNGEIERTAERLLRAAGLGNGEIPAAEVIASRLLGGGVRAVPEHVLRRDGALARVGAEWCVFVRSDLPKTKRAFTIFHEVGHWAIGRESTEAQCDALAAAMLAPRDAFLAAVERHGFRLPRLARCFYTTESCVALRLGEATGLPLALVTPTAIRLRGSAYSWPSESRMRELVRAPRTAGLRRCRLRDDEGRAVLRAAG